MRLFSLALLALLSHDITGNEPAETIEAVTFRCYDDDIYKCNASECCNIIHFRMSKSREKFYCVVKENCNFEATSQDPSNATRDITENPSVVPSNASSDTTENPSIVPSNASSDTTENPSIVPSKAPSVASSNAPSDTIENPSIVPSKAPSVASSNAPSVVPSNAPSDTTENPNVVPSNSLTNAPSMIPTECQSLASNRFLRRLSNGVLTEDDVQALLNKHNALRSEVALGNTDGEPMATDMTELVWDDTLAASSATYASECKFEHPGGNFGENLYATASTADNIDNIAKLVGGVQMWFDEYKDYTYGTIGGTEVCEAGKQCGHYTQVVWANTLSVGCGYSECGTRLFNAKFAYTIILVCRYFHPGNYGSQYPYTQTSSSTEIASECPTGYSKDATSGLCKLPDAASPSPSNQPTKPSEKSSSAPSLSPTSCSEVSRVR